MSHIAMDAAASSKRDFGSFHSSNVEELLRLPEAAYQPPNIPIVLPSFRSGDDIKFGQEAREAHFHLSPSWTFINHGAFGAVLKEALSAATAWQVYCETQPLRFLDRELLPLLALTTRQLASFIDAAPSELALIPNVTTGINSVIRSLCKAFSTQDCVIIFNTTYGAVKKLVRTVSEEIGFLVHELVIHFPLHSYSHILEVLETGLREQSSVKLVVIDHISSNHGIIFPVKEMVALCHSRGVEVLVDGAHALGTLPISMHDIGADYYISNAHKWLCNPKGCGFLYVRSSLQGKVRPLVVSHGYDSGFSSSYIWSGLKDYSPFLALNTVLEFWQSCGPDKIRDYITTTARDAGASLVGSWGTELLADSAMFGSMVLVALPEAVGWTVTPEHRVFRGPYDYSHAEHLQNTLYHNHQIEVPVKAVQGRLYVRISAHIYNTAEDYARLADAVNEITTQKLSLMSE